MYYQGPPPGQTGAPNTPSYPPAVGNQAPYPPPQQPGQEPVITQQPGMYPPPGPEQPPYSPNAPPPAQGQPGTVMQRKTSLSSFIEVHDC